MRFGVRGFLDAAPRATDLDLKHRFVTGSSVTGANLRRAYAGQPWAEHLQWFADNLLTSLFPLYEAWTEDVLRELHAPGVDANSKQMQFYAGATRLLPTGRRSPPKIGATGVVAQVAGVESPLLRRNVYPGLLSNAGCSPAHLDARLRCFRYFKEARNARIHGGGLASADAVEAYAAFLPVATADALDVGELDPIVPVVAGAPIVTPLRGVVGFGEIALNVMTTIDAELSRSALAEPVYLARWRAELGTVPKRVPQKAARRHAKLRGLIDRTLVPKFASVTELDAWLQQNGLLQLV